MNAIIFDRLNMIVFSPEPISEDARGVLLNQMGGRFLGDVDIEIPDDIFEWPRGHDRPENALAVARNNPRHFEAFKYRRLVDLDRYELSGMSYSVVPSWDRFLKALGPLNRIGQITDSSDRPGHDDEIMRDLSGSTL